MTSGNNNQLLLLKASVLAGSLSLLAACGEDDFVLPGERFDFNSSSSRLSLGTLLKFQPVCTI